MNSLARSRTEVPGVCLITSKEAASILGVSRAFLDRDRWAGAKDGTGPLIPYVKVGNRAVRYRLSDIHAHVDRRLSSHKLNQINDRL
jgi:predicted DNA-binding transcriptional regulator AlpA